jgi:hypothetical protein
MIKPLNHESHSLTPSLSPTSKNAPPKEMVVGPLHQGDDNIAYKINLNVNLQPAQITSTHTKTPLHEKPSIIFISGFSYFGLTPDRADGLKNMADGIEGAKHFSWDDKDKIMSEIKKHSTKQPLILVGHSLGGDTAHEVAEELNTKDHQFRKVDLLVTLDSFGFDHNLITENVKKNLNFIGQDSLFLNDRANMAHNNRTTHIINELRPESHSELDNSTPLQNTISESIFSIIQGSQSTHGE